MRLTLYALTNKDSPFTGANTTTFAYESPIDGRWWLADIEEDDVRSGIFTPDEEPSGTSFNTQEQLHHYIATDDIFHIPATEIGYIEDSKIVVTKTVKMETGWRQGPGGMRATEYDYLHPSKG